MTSSDKLMITLLKDIPGVGKFANHKPTLRNYADIIAEKFLIDYQNFYLYPHEGRVKLHIICHHVNKGPKVQTLIDVVKKGLIYVAFDKEDQIEYISVAKVPAESKKYQRLQIYVEYVYFD